MAYLWVIVPYTGEQALYSWYKASGTPGKSLVHFSDAVLYELSCRLPCRHAKKWVDREIDLRAA